MTCGRCQQSFSKQRPDGLTADRPIGSKLGSQRTNGKWDRPPGGPASPLIKPTAAWKWRRRVCGNERTESHRGPGDTREPAGATQKNNHHVPHNEKTRGGLRGRRGSWRESEFLRAAPLPRSRDRVETSEHPHKESSPARLLTELRCGGAGGEPRAPRGGDLTAGGLGACHRSSRVLLELLTRQEMVF